jgi:tRNAThr (cytosine32-N3)-methyltransferase
MDPLAAARTAIAAAHAADPEHEDGRPAELLYAERMETWLARVVERPSTALRLAALCQHLERWTLPRGSFPMDRAGYLRWRTTLYRRQAERAQELLLGAGIDAALAARVAALVAKTDLARDPETQALEDAACLVFLAHEVGDFAARKDYTREKWLDILRKTWRKMSPRGHQLALALPLDPGLRALVVEAVG